MSAMGHAAVLTRAFAARTALALGFTLLAAGASRAVAQTGTVIGTVADRGTGQPIDAARAQIVGTSLAGASDTRGAFVLRGVRPGTHNVRVSRIGFRPEVSSVTLAGNDTARVTFTLTQSAVELDQVVVTGTGGAVEKRKIGSSMGVVDMTQVQEQIAVTDIGQALSAKVTGLRSVSVGGGAGAARDLRIRGTASFSLSQRPVVYIDGVAYWNSAIVYVPAGRHTLNAFPYPGFVFDGWSMNGGAPSGYLSAVDIQAPVVLYPRFEPAKRVRFRTSPAEGMNVLVDHTTIPTMSRMVCSGHPTARRRVMQTRSSAAAHIRITTSAFRAAARAAPTSHLPATWTKKDRSSLTT